MLDSSSFYAICTVIPVQVVQELRTDPSSPDVDAYDWMRIEEPVLPESLRMVPDLGLGESGAIALALCSPAPLLILDDGLARRIAKLHGLRITGTAGVLLKAKERGLIREVRPILEDLVRAGFYLRNDHLTMLCHMANE